MRPPDRTRQCQGLRGPSDERHGQRAPSYAPRAIRSRSGALDRIELAAADVTASLAAAARLRHDEHIARALHHQLIDVCPGPLHPVHIPDRPGMPTGASRRACGHRRSPPNGATRPGAAPLTPVADLLCVLARGGTGSPLPLPPHRPTRSALPRCLPTRATPVTPVRRQAARPRSLSRRCHHGQPSTSSEGPDRPGPEGLQVSRPVRRRHHGA